MTLSLKNFMLDGSKFSKYLKMAMKSVNPKLDAIHRRKKNVF